MNGEKTTSGYFVPSLGQGQVLFAANKNYKNQELHYFNLIREGSWIQVIYRLRDGIYLGKGPIKLWI